MKSFLLTLSALFFFCSTTFSQTISTAKPWTYWWWMGSAVSQEDITTQLEGFRKAGLGGVHIIPIYGVKGFEKDFLPFLSDPWLAAMEHTVQEGKRLGLGVDMTTGTGWPFGGPNVAETHAARTMTFKQNTLAVQPTKQKVKRAAPGGEGWVLDPFHAEAMTNYLTRFDSTLVQAEQQPRAMYMDSYEAYGANWTVDFAEQFQQRRGYDLLPILNQLADTTTASELVRIDYHQTLAELLLERHTFPWTQWSRKNGFVTRYQAHGSPGNLLDLYEASDIPETESFGTSRFAIPGLRVDPDYSVKQFGTPHPLAMKFASSAAHFSGKKLVSSETGTWLANHFKVSLSQVKPQIDELFASGINHIFYHGTTYSPPAEGFPGWLFYASTNFGPQAHFAGHFGLLNRYVENCQNLLQNSQPDQDVLVYFPIHDLWATPPRSSGGIHLLEVHHVDNWLLKLPFGRLGEQLLSKGYAFDFVSDRQLERLRVTKDGVILSEGARYKTILIPSTTYLPQTTLLELQRLAQAGARLIFDGKVPQLVSGHANHATRQTDFQKNMRQLVSLKTVSVAANLDDALRKNGVVIEEMAAKGLTFIRKTQDGNPLYFVANLSNTFTADWLTVGPGIQLRQYDPLTEEETVLPTRKLSNKTQVFLRLLPGQSCFMKFSKETANEPFTNKPPRELALNGTWDLTFLAGKPSLPEAATMATLQSWTTLSDTARYFSGTARYTLKFMGNVELATSNTVWLDLGNVCEVAEAKLNGQAVGTAWSIPFRLKINPELIKTGENILEIEVTNLSANYMRLRDQQAPDWKKFYDINIVDITYGKFDATKWPPMPSGLLGPVRILY
ncbi:glycosyl hydrolase [Arundinibacter roseus]|uniref:Glycoside hydrolase n=1 Tax=Arundinibacter roseus TaxID=2070510 RepID=A0A4R4KCK7_9BACT|nr:glycosyl hydrolase [Arundinibacter roseus]TDB64211.1 glycoside hydrolase [Arundinibacter roseus]